MKLPKILSMIHKELGAVLKRVDEEPVERLLDAAMSVEKVYLAGQGRSGLMARAFAMRLMHLGLTSFVAGETVTPAFMKNDLMIACSGSGETKITLHLAESAKERGGRLAAVTANPNSSLAQLADILILLPCGEAEGGPKAPQGGQWPPLRFGNKKTWTRSIQFGRALFEQCSLLLFDAMILRLAARLGKEPDDIARRHTNLE